MNRGINTLEAKWLDPACHKGCQSLVIPQKILELFREKMNSAVKAGYISEENKKYSCDVLQLIVSELRVVK